MRMRPWRAGIRPLLARNALEPEKCGVLARAAGTCRRPAPGRGACGRPAGAWYGRRMHAVASGLARRIGLFDATMIVMGGIVGSGIFVTPADVARSAGSPALILGAWVVGGIAALLGAFVYAELSSVRPEVGGQYAYLREAVHPLAAFLYGWALLLVIQTGGMAATAIAFARYFRELLPIPFGEGAVAAAAVAALTVVNCMGVRAGCTAQSALMVLKICALAALIAAGLLFGGAAPSSGAPGSPAGFGAAGISISTLGFLSQSILTAPRVYFAMAEDGLFFRSVARVHPRTRAPIVAIALQGALAIAIALAGTFEAITRYVVSIDFVFFGLTAACIFVFRRRGVRGTFTIPGHPATTAAFIAICAAVVFFTWRADPVHAFAGLGITLAGIPAFLLWRSRSPATAAGQPGPPAPPG